MEWITTIDALSLAPELTLRRHSPSVFHTELATKEVNLQLHSNCRLDNESRVRRDCRCRGDTLLFLIDRLSPTVYTIQITTCELAYRHLSKP